MSDLTDTLLILGSQLLAGLPEEATACSDLTFVRCISLLLSNNITRIRGQSCRTTRG